MGLKLVTLWSTTHTSFYWDINDGWVKRGNGVAPVALGSKFRWLLSGAETKDNPSSLTTHVEVNVVHIKTANLGERKIDNFWKLDLLGIQEKEFPVCEKVMEDINFENNRYVVKLPLKKNIPFVSDNYGVSLNYLGKLKNRLSKSTDTSAKYDKVITLREKCPNTELFLVRILRSISPYSVRMWESTDQK